MINKSKIKNQKSKIKNLVKNLKFLILVCNFTFYILHFTSFCFAQEEKLIEVKAKKFSYDPNIIKVKKGDHIRIRLISEDVTHGLYLDGYELETRAHPGQDGSISFVAERSGKFVFRCSVTCGEFHPYMVGYMIVEPNSPFYLFTFLTLVLGLGGFLIIALRKE